MNIVILNISSAIKLWVELIVLLLGACTWSVKKPSILVQKNGENTTVTQTPAVVESEESSKPTTQEKLPQKVAIKNLVDGNYRFCTEPPSKTPYDHENGWCFVFRKTNNSVIGGYFLSVPKGDRGVCISGILNSNMVVGVGYELMFGWGWDKPVTSADIAKISPEPIWDEWYSEGRNLRVSPPRLDATGKDSGGYYGWVRYDSVRLDLSEFYQHNLERTFPPKKCPY